MTAASARSEQGADVDELDEAGGDRFDPELCGVQAPIGALTFEQLLAALELVTSRLANGELGIEAAADLYEQAEILHGAAARRLEAVEARISRLRNAKPG